jgi:hypothetical protein
MTKFEKRIFTLTNIVISVIGVAYLIFKYFYSIETQFGERPHPLTGDLLHLHIITVPFLIFVIGHLFGRHIYPKLKSGKQKRKNSGVFILILFILVSLSGYILQIAVSEMNEIGIAHSVLSIFWFIFSVWHSRKNLKDL